MGKVVIDGNSDLIAEESKPTTLSEVFDEIEKLCESKNREISKVRIDGEFIKPEEINQWMDKTLDDIQQIEIDTISEQEMSLEQLLVANTYLGEAEDIITDFIEKGKMDYQDAVLAVVSVMNKWEDACRMIDSSAKQLGIDYTSLEFSGVTFSQQHNTSMEIINELTGVMSGKDIVAIRDILEYRFMPQIKTYGELIKAVAKEFENELAK